jgi:proteic killer suppression protein
MIDSVLKNEYSNRMDVKIVKVSKKAQKDITKIPLNLQEKLYFWVRAVTEFGLLKVRQSKGFHDEPLHGDRKGQRSIRLNKSYRAIYIEKNDGLIEFVEIEEVNKHEY